MKIAKIELDTLCVPLTTPFKTALRTVYEIDDVLIRLYLENGLMALGEAPPTVAITGEDKQDIQDTIINIMIPLILDLDILKDFDLIIYKIKNSIKGHTSAKAGMEIAIYNAKAMALNKPLYKMLGGKNKKTLITDITISVDSVEKMVADSLIAIKQGFSILKVKVGSDSSLDLERLISIQKAVGDKIKLRIDVNQAWSFEESILNLKKMKECKLNIEFVEQPLNAKDYDGMAKLTALKIFPIVADESLFSLENAKTLLAMNACDILNIKLMKTGGVSEAIKIIELAKKHNKAIMMGSMLESIISINTAIHLCMVYDHIKYIDLDGPILCKYIPELSNIKYNKEQISIL